MNNRNEFVFERDTGIVFQHAQPSEQPFPLKNDMFTIIPKLESVHAEEYNRQFEEMRKSMPKSPVSDNIIPPGVSASRRSARKSAPSTAAAAPVSFPVDDVPAAVSPTANYVSSSTANHDVSSPTAFPVTDISSDDTSPSSFPVSPVTPKSEVRTSHKTPPPPKEPKSSVSSAPKPPVQSPPKQPKTPPVQNDEPVFYTGYDESQQQQDPFNDDTFKTQEMIIGDNSQKPPESFKDKFKRTLKKFFSTAADDEDYDD